MMKQASALLAIAALAAPAYGQGDNPGTQEYLSRPGFYAVKLDIQVNKDPKALGPGIIMATPYGSGYALPDMGIHMWDRYGELVFLGPEIQEKRANDAHVCNYLGKPALCFTDAIPGQGFGPGHSSGPDRFFDNSYTQLGHDYGAIGNLTLPDAHELNTPDYTNGQSFINDVFQPLKYNLTMYDGPAHGWLMSGCFQQRSIKENKLQFQWCSDAHVELYETYNYIVGNSAGNASIAKNHGTHHFPWDYFHINSIDQDKNGDYYVSSRACHTIYKIAGLNSPNPGNVIWRLGGRYSNFTVKGRNFQFYTQHAIRVDYVHKHRTMIHLYDNHYPAPKHGKLGGELKRGSSGKFILLNTKDFTSELVQEYYQPDGKYTPTGGWVQPLSNGNVFIGWGADPSFSEYRKGNPGELLFYATFHKHYASYRTWKQPWVGKPKTPPDVFAYQHKCNSKKLVVYTSWNGATEYTSVQIFGQHKHNITTGGTHLGTFKRTGYETRAEIPTGKKFQRYIYVNTLDKKGNVLGTSNPLDVFVPKKKLAKKCNTYRCPKGTVYGNHHSRAGQC